MSDVDLIKERLQIEEIVGQYVKLKPAGSRLKGLSPFTAEKTPSFFVSPDQGLYHCFSTGKGGDIFSFIQEMEGVDFRGALTILADRAGIELKNTKNFKGQKREPKDEIYQALDLATQYFTQQLDNSQVATNFLEERGVSPKTRDFFRIGYAPDGWQNLNDHLKIMINPEILSKAGLVKQKDSRTYDTFRNRIMFPIMDAAGRVIAFSGRVLESDKDVAKYLNSPDTPVFNKSKALFGFYQARQSIRKLDFTILVEGQFDLVLVSGAGYPNVVATSGTAFTPDHLKLLSRYSPNLLIAFDSDRAGIEAMLKVAAMAYGSRMNVKAITLPPGSDPADIIKSDQVNGTKVWKDLVQNSQTIAVVAYNYYRETAPNETRLRRQIRENLLPLISLIRSPIEKSNEIDMLAQASAIPSKLLIKELGTISRGSATTKNNAQSTFIEMSSHSSTIDQKTKMEKKLADIYHWLAHNYPDVELDNVDLYQSWVDKKEIREAAVFSDYKNKSEALSTYTQLVKDLKIFMKKQELQQELDELEKTDKTPEVLDQIIAITRRIDKIEKEG